LTERAKECLSFYFQEDRKAIRIFCGILGYPDRHPSNMTIFCGMKGKSLP